MLKVPAVTLNYMKAAETTIICVCVCVCVFSSHSFWTSSSLDVPAGVTQEEGHTGFLIHLLSAVHALIFLAIRIQPFLSLVDCKVEFCVLNDLIVFHPLGILIFFFSFLVRKIPFAGIELTSQRVRGLRGTSELPGRPACRNYFFMGNVQLRVSSVYICMYGNTYSKSMNQPGKVANPRRG